MKNIIDLFLNRSKYVVCRQVEKTKITEETKKLLLIDRKMLFDNFTCNSDFAPIKNK